MSSQSQIQEFSFENKSRTKVFKIEKQKNKLNNKETTIEQVTKPDKISLSYINSQAARNGYKEEELICKDLNSEIIKKLFSPIVGDYDECNRITGNHKCDLQSMNKILKAQAKKFKKNQFQQLDRHWINNLIENIPELNNKLQILKDLCEYPLLPNRTHVNKTIPLKKLCISNYSQETLDNFINLLNKFKKQILNYAFLGTNLEMQPEYLFGVEYKDNKRKQIILFKIKEIIDYLEKLEFKISPKKTVILLGVEGIISLQRKGGDNGKKSSNQLQIKIILSKLINKVVNLQYKL